MKAAAASSSSEEDSSEDEKPQKVAAPIANGKSTQKAQLVSLI